MFVDSVTSMTVLLSVSSNGSWWLKLVCAECGRTYDPAFSILERIVVVETPAAHPHECAAARSYSILEGNEVVKTARNRVSP